MELEPQDLDIRDRYKLLIGCIVPRPIAFVSTVSTDGALNLAPFSFFNGVGSDPMTILFCPANKPDGSEKDTLRNCKPTDEGGTGQFVVNAAIYEYRRAVAGAAEPLEHGESEFDLTGLNTTPSETVRPPRVAESPWAFECHTVQVIRTNPGRSAGGNIVIGEVRHVYIRDDLLNERFHIDPAALDAIGRMGGLGYCTTRDRFEMRPGRASLTET